ncbi:hypothetical protein JB92DRAFT_3118195 [Gautieria morchelliformis]|nr:hypothetical protein JB92DRAFT_3118195 [Gautieria morchelliformis]
MSVTESSSQVRPGHAPGRESGTRIQIYKVGAALRRQRMAPKRVQVPGLVHSRPADSESASRNACDGDRPLSLRYQSWRKVGPSLLVPHEADAEEESHLGSSDAVPIRITSAMQATQQPHRENRMPLFRRHVISPFSDLKLQHSPAKPDHRGICMGGGR